MARTCIFCEKNPCKASSNNCGSWACTVESARRRGVREVTPNGLPIRCITDDGMLEHEHGDHPDYKFPVEVIYIGPEPEKKFGLVDSDGKEVPAPEGWIESETRQEHALIYSDNSVAITLYEHCYAMWYLRNGRFGGGALWDQSEWRLTDKSVLDIRAGRFLPS